MASAARGRACEEPSDHGLEELQWRDLDARVDGGDVVALHPARAVLEPWVTTEHLACVAVDARVSVDVVGLEQRVVEQDPQVPLAQVGADDGRGKGLVVLGGDGEADVVPFDVNRISREKSTAPRSGRSP